MKQNIVDYRLEIPEPETLNEAKDVIRDLVPAYREVLAVLTRTLRENETLYQNLKATQTRCTELIDIARELRRVALRVVQEHEAFPGVLKDVNAGYLGDLALVMHQLKVVVERDPANYQHSVFTPPADVVKKLFETCKEEIP